MKISKSVLAVVLGSLIAASGSAMADDLKGDATAAKNKVAMCIGCHAIPGYRSSVPEIYTVPMLGGQSEKYLVNALKAYSKGERKHPTMRSIAAGLSEQDMADIAAYYSQQTK